MTFFHRLPRRAILIAGGILLLAAFATVLARSGPLAPTRVTIVTVQPGTMHTALFGIGSVEAKRSYAVGPTAAGRVLRVLVDVGDTVRAGQLLAEMDPVDLDQRSSALDASISRAGSAVASAEAQLRDAQARQELATLNARRYTELGAQRFVSTSAVEAKQQELASAAAGTSAAAANLAGARQDTARLQAERAGLRQQRQHIRLLAPTAGLVTTRDAEAGSTVVAGQTIVKLIEPTSLWVKTRIDQGRSAGLAVGLPASIVLRSAPGQPLAGKVVRVELQSDNIAEERIAQVAFDDIPAGVSLGELAEVTLQLPASQSGLLLPNASIKRQAGATGVWASRNGELRFLPVRLGSASLDGQVLVREGLQAGDRVIVHSEKEIGVGSRIQIAESLLGQGS